MDKEAQIKQARNAHTSYQAQEKKRNRAAQRKLSELRESFRDVWDCSVNLREKVYVATKRCREMGADLEGEGSLIASLWKVRTEMTKVYEEISKLARESINE